VSEAVVLTAKEGGQPKAVSKNHPLEIAQLSGWYLPVAAALYVGRSVASLATMRCRGGGPPFVKKGRILYPRTALDAWLTSQGMFRNAGEAKAAALAE
jgi:hypothetical protein